MSDAFEPRSNPGRQDMSEPCRKALQVALADLDARRRAGMPVNVETYFANETVLRVNPEAALDLIYKEILARTAAGESPALDEYVRRFPDLEKELRPLFEVHRAMEASAAGITAPGSPNDTTRLEPAQDVTAPKPLVTGYELLQRIGQGGMAVVYKARQKSLDRIVALKMILAGAHASPESLARFRQEAEIVAKLAHVNIVQIHEIGELDGRPFLSLEFVEGGSLHQKLRGAPLPPRDAARLAEILARAIHHAHVRGIVHRDLKPANVLMSANDLPKITDFGLARFGAGSGQTQSGDIIGTPSYMAPEQADGDSGAIGPATDIYALGATLYELLTGRPPFRADSALETLRQVIDEEPVSPSQLQPGVPRDLVTVCLKCLQKTPSKRYVSAEALADDLRRFLDGKPILARQTPVWERTLKWAKRRPALASLYAVIAAAALMIGLYNLWLQSTLSDANKQRSAATKASEERRQQLVQVLLADGARQLDEGDWFGALLPYAEAARLDQNDPTRAAVHAVRLNTILGQCPRLVQFWPHDGEVRHAEFHPDGSAALTVVGNRALLWDVASGKEIARISHDSAVRAVALSPDGRHLATATDDRRVQLWDTRTGHSLGRLPARDGEIARVAFLAGKNHVAIVTRKSEKKIQIQVWDVVGGEAVSPELHTEAGVFLDSEFSPDGRRVFTAGAALTVFDVHEARSLFEEPGDTSLVTQARFSPDGQFVAAADLTGAVRIWDAGSGKKLATVRHAPPIRDMAFSPDSRLLITGGLDGMAHVWRLPDGNFAAELRHGPAFTHAVSQVTFSPDGRHNVLIAGADNTARIWAGVTPASPLLRHSDRVLRASFSPDGRLVLTACADGTVRVWDLAAGRLSVPPLAQDGRVIHAAFDAEGGRVITGSDDGVARIWDTRTGKPRGLPFVHDFPIRTAAFAADGQIVTTGDDNTRGEGEACVWDADNRNLVFRRATTQKVPGATPNDRGIRRAWFSPSGRYLLALDGPGAGQIWDTKTGQPVTGVLEHKSVVNGASFNADGSRLLTNTFAPEHSGRLWEAAGKPLRDLYRQLRPDNTLAVWALPTGKPLASIGKPGSETAFRYATFSPPGDRLILMRNGAAELYDANTGELVRTFRKPGTKIIQAALRPDSRTLVTASDDRTAQLWNVANGQIMPTPRQFQHGGQNWPPQFSPDGRFLVLHHAAGARVWDAATGDPISPPLIHATDVDCVAFSPDGRLLLTASDYAARLWPLNSEERDVNTFLMLAQFLCCARKNPEDARLVPLNADDLTRLWDIIRQDSDTFTTPSVDATAWHAEAALACERNQLWNAALAHLERLTKREPARPDLFDRKGRAHAELGQMTAAVKDFATAVKLGADRPGPWYRHALLHLHLGNQQAYNLACDSMLDRFSTAKDGADVQLAVRACILAAGTPEMVKRVVAIAARNLAASPKDHARLLLLGAAQYRARHYSDAERSLIQAVTIRGKDDAINDLFLALTYHRMGDREQAKMYVQQAARSIGQAAQAGGALGNTRFTWSDRLELILLRREVDTLLMERKP